MKPNDKQRVFGGSEQAAILLMTLGEKDASEILKHMSPKEVQRLGEAMAGLGSVTQENVNTVLADFCETVGAQTNLGVGTEDYLRNILNMALGPDKAGGLIDRILLGRSSKGIEALKWMEPRAVAEIIRLEHPQIIAIVMSHLDPDQAAEVVVALPEKMRADILMRIATLDGIQPNALHELDNILDRQFSGQTGSLKTSVVGGIKTAANILNFMETNMEGLIMDGILETDAKLGENIRELMFVFDNLIELEDRGVQALLREVSSDTLILALKGAEEGLKEKIFKNMSKRAAEMLADDLEAKGPVRLSDVEAAQKEILTVARRMAEAGEISLSGKGEEYV